MVRHGNTLTRRTTSPPSGSSSSTASSSVVKKLSNEEKEPFTAEVTEPFRNVFWRSETSFSDDEDSDVSTSPSTSANSEGSPALVIKPGSSAGTSFRREQLFLGDDEVVPLDHQVSYTVVHDNNDKRSDVYVEVDLEKYMSTREMTPLQERWNAITMIPPPVFCICFLLSGNWISKQLLSDAIKSLLEQKEISFEEVTATFDDDPTCFDWSNMPVFGSLLFRYIYAMPPLPLIAITLGVVAHAPFSFLYHWKYSHALSPSKRSQHWSRRMDQSMIHVSSALTSFGTSGSWDFFLVNVLFNPDSIIRQFQPTVIPRRNQGRLGVAIIAWALPILKRGDWDMFFAVLLTLAIGFFLFIKYPIGGWSHAAFHLTLLPLMPLVLTVAMELPAAQGPLRDAAHCFALAELRNTYSS